jgi:hypothetical protein
MAFVQARAPSPPDDTPVNIVALTKKYHDLYARYGLPANFSVHRILELYWHISRDLGRLCVVILQAPLHSRTYRSAA